MASQLYRVVFEGRVIEGRDVREAKRNLARLFKVTEEKIERYFVGRPIVIKKDLDQQTAIKYEKAFRSAGAICHAESMDSLPGQPSAPATIQPEMDRSVEPEMMECPKCGLVQQRAEECASCGIVIKKYVEKTAAPFAQMAPQREDEDLVAFIGNNSDTYLRKFRKFNMNGTDNFGVTWHWPAFFLGFWWMLYRKLYLWALLAFVLALIPGVSFIAWITWGMTANYIALLAFVLALIPGVSFIVWITWGMTANYIYYKYAKKKIAELRTSYPSSNITSTLVHIGGVNRWVAVLGVIFVFVAVAGIIAAILIPALVGTT
jgi:hypothetical protein